jgi:hypothetical protein
MFRRKFVTENPYVLCAHINKCAYVRTKVHHLAVHHEKLLIRTLNSTFLLLELDIPSCIHSCQIWNGNSRSYVMSLKSLLWCAGLLGPLEKHSFIRFVFNKECDKMVWNALQTAHNMGVRILNKFVILFVLAYAFIHNSMKSMKMHIYWKGVCRR